jgi:outer membrane protein OmpA-like peptidoglycan-associated protein
MAARSRSLARCLIGLLLALSVVIARDVSASVLHVAFVNKVRVGKTPSIKITAEREASDAVLELKREDGQGLVRSLGAFSAGETKEVQLDAEAGEHRYEGSLRASAAGTKEVTPLAFETAVLSPLELSVDKSKVDLDEGRLQAVLSRTAETLEIRLFGAADSVLFESKQDISKTAAGQPFVVSWTKVPRSELVRLELKVTDRHGFFHVVTLTPWAFSIPHEQVNFDLDSDKIKSSEVPKLKASLDKIREALARYAEFGGVKLYIAGHTDTQGTAAHNLDLSRRRARAIASWFSQNGLGLPIFFEGFGKSALLVKTADQVDEPRNRRVDYILAMDEPGFKSKDHQPSWKQLNP